MKSKADQLSRRERQIMDIIYGNGEATAAEVRAALPDAPGYSAVRALLRILETKGMLKHREDGPRYIYLPTQAPEKARRSALKQVVRRFFDGSLANAMAALIESGDSKLEPEELRRLEEIIKKAKTK